MSLGEVDGEYDRIRLRALRAAPPALADKHRDRRRVFAAALGQFDELLTAARTVGPASAPLLLYYALSQAGRAIAAAHQEDPERWRPNSHGLQVSDPPRSLEAVVVNPKPRQKKGGPRTDIFSVVADTVGSPLLTGPVVLGALWAAAPGTKCVKRLGATHQRTARLRQDVLPSDPYPGRAWFCGPELEGISYANSWWRAVLGARFEKAYPTTRSRIKKGGETDKTNSPTHDQIELGESFNLLGGEVRELSFSVGLIEKVASLYPDSRGDYYLMPGLGRNEDVLAPFMVWWVLLYVFSHLARYHPATWAKVLDPVRSVLATPIEHALVWAYDMLPRAVLHELIPTKLA